MPEEARRPLPVPEFPIQPSKQQVQRLTAALLADSLSVLGLGVPSQRTESGKLQSWMWGFHGDFEPNIEQTLGKDALAEYRRSVRDVPSIESVAGLSPAQILAIRTRLYAIFGVVEDRDLRQAGDWLWEVYKQAVFAHQWLRNSDTAPGNLRIVEVMTDLLQRHSRQKFESGWNHGLTMEDVRSVVVTSLLHPDAIFCDICCWIRILKDGKLGRDDNSAELDTELARNAISAIIVSRSAERLSDVQRCMSQILALSEMEHELLEDSQIDAFCHNLRISSSEVFPLGPRGHIELGSPLGTSANSQPITGEELAQIDEILEEHKRRTRSPEDEERYRQARAWEKQSAAHNFEPITPSRALIVWRGAPSSAEAARRSLPILLRATVRTAWLATCGSDSALRLFLDQRYREADPEFRGPAVFDSDGAFVLARPIAIHPEEFPVKEWMTFVLSQAIPGSAPSGAALSFGINAVRLLNSADDLLRVDLGQSFACSMSAIEACIGGKGTDLSEKVGRRAARLLVPTPLMRAKAIDSFKTLYSVRSRVVHGDDCRVSRSQAVFMRYLASCVVYGLAGFARAAPRFGLPSSEDGIRKYLDQDAFSDGPLMGAATPWFANKVLCSDGPASTWLESK
jgi:hypothetical protein